MITTLFISGLVLQYIGLRMIAAEIVSDARRVAQPFTVEELL